MERQADPYLRPGRGARPVGVGCRCDVEEYADGRDEVCECPNGDCAHYCKTHDIFHCPYAHDQSRTRDGLRCVKCGRRIRHGHDDDVDEHHYTNDTGPTRCDRCAYHDATDGASIYDASIWADFYGWQE